MPYDMRIKEVSGRAYLYEVTDRRGNMKSKGPLDTSKQAEFDRYKAEKAMLKDLLGRSKETLAEQSAAFTVRCVFLCYQQNRVGFCARRIA
jgi:hypothetical protein